MRDVFQTFYYKGEIERLKTELAEAILKKKDASIRWARLYEKHGDVIRALAEANAKIRAARALHTSTRGLPENDDLAKFWCGECGQPYPCNTLDVLDSSTPKPTDDSYINTHNKKSTMENKIA